MLNDPDADNLTLDEVCDLLLVMKGSLPWKMKLMEPRMDSKMQEITPKLLIQIQPNQASNQSADFSQNLMDVS